MEVRLKKRIYKSMGILLFFTLVISYLLVTFILYREFSDSIKREVKNEVLYLQEAMNYIDDDTYETLLSTGSNRITLVDETGAVLFDTKERAFLMENHANRKEIMDAKELGIGEDTRLSKTLGKETYYHAVRLSNHYILRVAATTDSVFSMIKNNIPVMALFAIIIICVAFIIIRWQTNKMILPINNLNLEEPLENDIYEELGPLLYRIDKQNRQIEEQWEMMKEKREEFSTITDYMKEALIVINHKAVILSLNKAALMLFHTTIENAISRHILSISRDNNLKEAFEHALSGTKIDKEMIYQDRNFQIMANPVVRNGKVQGAVILVVDITEKQKSEQMRREFAANVSHELKTPLTSISGYAELLANGLVKEEDVIKFADSIFQEAGRMIQLVDDIIWLSKLDEGNVTLEFEKVDLLALSRDVIKRLDKKAVERKITFSLDGIPVVYSCIRQIIEEIIFNLCDNAIKYNNEGGNVTLRIRKKGKSILLSVSDTGIGIAEAEQHRIFERFYRVDKSHSKKTGGTGLGLSIVKHGVMLHHGKIEVESEIDIGTTIKLYFRTGDDMLK